ncbi:uncharacterized protein EMH_0030570 [Eimeria mitis]|uniref:Ppg3 n=1 Tax=Eimeria mitis TaxID=44415 RepID=U6K2T6_9EIME|nr:uncharacterized protein EMH_0030570 [Eimeria mitis]CDJ30637.1 hypothetical protein, conserved [Eimeria mitis]
MMQHLLAEGTSRETDLNAAHETSTAAPHAPAAPPVVVVSFQGASESQNPRDSTYPSQPFGFRYGQQQEQQDEKQIHHRDQRRKDQLPSQTSSPLVLKGRVRYSFATRTVDGYQTQSLRSGPAHPDSEHSTSTRSSNFSSCSGGVSASNNSTGSSATATSRSLGAASAPFPNSFGEDVSRKFNEVEAASSSNSGSSGARCSGSSSAGGGSSIGSNDSTINGGIKSSRDNNPTPSDGHYVIPLPSPGSAAASHSWAASKKPNEGDCRSISSRGTDISSSASNGKSGNNGSNVDNCSNERGDAERKQRIPLLSASDISLLLRDYAGFVQRTERQLQQLQKLVQQQQSRNFEGDSPEQQQQYLGSTWVGSCGQPLTNKSTSVRQQHHWQQQQHQQHLEEAKLLRRLIAEGAVVCHSLHSRLHSLLVDSPSSDVAAAGSELLLGKLRRDFVQQQQQYSRLVRLLSSAADLLCEPPEPSHQHDVAATASSASNTTSSNFGSNLSGPAPAGGPARIIWHRGHQGSPCSLPVDCLHFEDPQRRRETQSIIWGSESDHFGTSSVRTGNSSLQPAGGGVWPQDSTGALPPLFIGPSDTRTSAADGSLQDGLWEPAALIEVHEDYEKQQIITERKQQLHQLQQVEHCVTVLRELQLHVAADVERGNQRLHAVEEETEAAADHTASGVGELATAARSKTRWWGVQGGSAAALLGVSVGAVAGGPIGAAVGAIVGAVAGLSSGAALRARHRERINGAERSVRRRRAQRLKRSSLTPSTGGINTSQSTASGAANLGSRSQTSGASTQLGVINSRPPLWDFGGLLAHSSSGARPCGEPASMAGRHASSRSAESCGVASGPSAGSWVSEPVSQEGGGPEAEGPLQTGQRRLAAGRRRQRHQRPNRRLSTVQTTVGATGRLPVFQFFP